MLWEKEINKYIGIAVSVIAVIMLFLDWVKIPVLSLLDNTELAACKSLKYSILRISSAILFDNADGLYL